MRSSAESSREIQYSRVSQICNVLCTFPKTPTQPDNLTTRQHTSSPPLSDHDISEFPHKVPHVKLISTSSVFLPWRSGPHKTHRLSLYRSTVSSEPYASRQRLDDLTTQHTGKPQIILPGTTSRYHRVKTFFFSVGATRRAPHGMPLSHAYWISPASSWSGPCFSACSHYVCTQRRPSSAVISVHVPVRLLFCQRPVVSSDVCGASDLQTLVGPNATPARPNPTSNQSINLNISSV